MQGEELVIGGNPALAAAKIEAHNQRAERLREARRVLRANKVEIGLDEYRNLEEIAITLGLMAIAHNQQNQV